jgi:hypothetical protein
MVPEAGRAGAFTVISHASISDQVVALRLAEREDCCSLSDRAGVSSLSFPPRSTMREVAPRIRDLAGLAAAMKLSGFMVDE